MVNIQLHSQSARFSAALIDFHKCLAASGRNRQHTITGFVDSLIVLFTAWLAYLIQHGRALGVYKQICYIFAEMSMTMISIFTQSVLQSGKIQTIDIRLTNKLFKICSTSAGALLVVVFLFFTEQKNMYHCS